VTSEKQPVSENSGRVKKTIVRSDVTTVDADRPPFSAHSRTDVAINLMNSNAKFAVSFVFGTFWGMFIHFILAQVAHPSTTTARPANENYENSLCIFHLHHI
jgi:hypothetical protein